MNKTLDDTQALLRAATGIAWEWYRCGEEWQLMPYPRDKGNDHPFWDWYCFKKKQFYPTQLEAAAMLLQWWRAWHTGFVADAYDKTHGCFRAMDFATKRERKEWTHRVSMMGIDAICVRDNTSPDSYDYKRMNRLVSAITEFPHLLP